MSRTTPRGIAAAVVPAVVLTLALVHPGASVAQVDLHDGTVWLTNSSQLKLGRYNPMVGELNGGLVAGSAELDVRQDGLDVLLLEPGRVALVDPATVATTLRAEVPVGADVHLAGGTVLVSDPDTGGVWYAPVGDLAGLGGDGRPALDLGASGRAVLARSGAVLAVRADGTALRVPVEEGLPGEPIEAGALAGTGRIDAVTAVGETLVVLSGATVRTADRTVDLARWGTDLTLQQPGPAADTVLVATPGALLEVPLRGGPVVETPSGGSGVPAAPVRVGACAHGAWATGVGNYLRRCADEVTAFDLEGLTSADRLVFRVNRDVVVLNDTRQGRLWVPLEDATQRDPNWWDIEPESLEEDDQLDESSKTVEDLLTECTAEPASPVAVDDAFGVRAGRTTVLSVLDNDGAVDCGVLTVSQVDPVSPAFGTLERIHGGRALQLTTAPGARGTATFTYTVSDGRGAAAPATATVEVTVVDPAVDRPPVQLRESVLVVEQGAMVSDHVLAGWRDPDGDELVLVGASVEGAGTVRTRWDGVATFRADAGTLGRQEIRVQVSDGRSTSTGTVWVDVRPPGSLAPLVGPVQATTQVDVPVEVAPLAEVRNPTREELRLAAVEQVHGATVTADLGAGTFRFTAATPGTYYVPFLVTAGPQQAGGLARVDVVAPPEESAAPVATRDVVFLPPGGDADLAPLVNDADPAGGVLVLQDAQAPPDSGVRVAVVDHEKVRVDATRTLDGPVTVTYTVSNGTAVAEGEILVQPVPAATGQQAPVVPAATAQVRTGGVVTIPVLEGAYDPDGDAIALDRRLAEPLGADEGLLFVSGDVLRYRAPEVPMTVRATFRVVDEHGNETAGTLTVDVHASDAATKVPPAPRDLEARVFAEDTVRIPVPLTGIDVDGDGVYLLGIATAPTKGILTATGPDWLEYQALPGETGIDTFTYAVEDWVGQRSVATVRVGIAPRPLTAARIVARPDEVTVRPGRSIEVRVLANDVDSSGGRLALDSLDLTAAVLPEGVVPGIEGRRVVVTTPDEPTVMQIPYVVTNDRGGRDASVLTVVVDPDAPYRPPVATDVVVPATETINRTEVEVAVLDVAANPSGPVSDLAVSVHPSVADVATVTEAGTVTVRLVDRAQTLPYLLTNTDPEAEGISAYAFITVPALGDFPPILRPGEDPPVVVAGEQIEISVEQYVQVGPGKTPRVVDASTVTATRSDGSSLVRDETTLLYRSRIDHAGPASISFEVVDGPVGAPATYRRVLTLPITVLAAEVYPPTFRPSTLDVAAGESVRVDLTAFTSAPVGTAAGTQTYAFTVSGQPGGGVTAAVDGTVLTLTADPTAPRGTVGGVRLELDYGGPEPMAVQVDYRVLASARQLARVLDHDVPDGVEGRARTVGVLTGAFNPFAPDPLTVVGVSVDGADTGTAQVQGNQVIVRPAEGFIGRMVARYRVRDVTGDPQREVEGRVLVTVRGRPAAPTTPRVVEVRDRTVVLAWDAPAHNGEPITGYRVTAQPGGITRECASTTCTIDGLTNNVEYTFTVQARNAVDLSDPSPPSATVRPDAVPGAPGTPVLTFGDGQLSATWAPAESTGSPITSYTLELSPAPAAGPASITVTGTSATVGNLVNGTAYGVRVRATNRAPEPGPWSAYAFEVPARVPGAPAVTALRVDTELGGAIEVSWTEPDAGGDPIHGYTVEFSGGPGEGRLTGATSYRLTGAQNGVAYTFSVRARNKAGDGPAGTASAVPFGVPGPMTLTATGLAGGAPGAGTVRLDWAPPTDDGGSAITGFEIRHDTVVVERPAAAARTLTLGGLRGGVRVAYEIRAVNAAGYGPWTTPAEAIPRTLPAAPQQVRVTEVVYDPNTGMPTHLVVAWDPVPDTGTVPGEPVEYGARARYGRNPVSLTWTAGNQATLPIGQYFGSDATSRAILVEVVARTPVGTGAAQSITVEVTVEPPGPVRTVTAAPAAEPGQYTHFTVSWAPPSPLPRAPLTRYEVRHRVAGGDTWTIHEVTELEVHSLTLALPPGAGPGSLVDVRVRAHNVAGPGPWNDPPVSFTVPTPPEPEPGPEEGGAVGRLRLPGRGLTLPR